MQPAEPKSTAVACWRVPTVKSFISLAIAGWIGLALTSCTTTQGWAGLEVTPQTVPHLGGEVNLRWRVEGARAYTLRSEPPLPGLPLSTTGSSVSIWVAANSSPEPKRYRLIVESDGPEGLKQVVAELRLEGRPPCSSIGAQSQRIAVRAFNEVGLGRFDVPHVAGRLLVYHKKGLSLQSHTASAQSLGAQRVQDLGGGWGLYRTQPGQEAQVAQKLYQQGLGQYVQPEYLYQPASLVVPPNNPSYPTEQAPVFQQMNIEQAWQKLRGEVGCQTPIIAVVDTGVYTQRNDLAPNLTPPDSWLDVVGEDLSNPQPARGTVEPEPGTGASHGTQVTSIIAATTNNGTALAGVAYNLLRVLPIKVFDANQQAGTLQIAQALEYAAGATQIAGQLFVNPTPAQVVNLSLSLSAPGFRDPYLEHVLEQVTQQGLVVVASSGNADLPAVGYPASSPFVIAVGATDAGQARARWLSGYASNYGEGLEFVAPGTGVPVAHGPNQGAYALAYGTSASAPFISGAIGLYLLQQQLLGQTPPSNPGARLDQVRTCLKSAAQNAPAWDSQTGYGLVDVAKVVEPSNPACFPRG
ncbi:S8 family peptidase [Meiothermus ruber]|uniref:S8 family peptidase n=1 Tax=Meiothermus ruber TaxID=277 RepID=UPI0012602DCE|nr:S8 family serine peptidase [Meiothermus ruber]MCL6529308.1 S8 family serine peptidase [Meiothermus ruber]